jgi:protein gp37
MNKTKIEWADSTWNPVTGCLHGCDYCYARKITNRFGGASETHYNECVGEECQWCTEETGKIHDLAEPIYDVDRGHNAPYPFGFDPTFHRYRLAEPQQKKNPLKIFVVSMGDLFGEWVPDEWIQEVFRACEDAPQHTYMFLTKNPKRYKELQFKIPLPTSDKYWYGTTITNHEDTQKLAYLGGLASKTFVSIEPLQGAVDLENVQFGKYTTMNVLEGCGINMRNCCQSIPNTYCNKIEWVIIGAQTGPGAKPPKPEWVQSIIDQCRSAGVPVFVKPPLYEKFPIQEWPEKILCE